MKNNSAGKSFYDTETIFENLKYNRKYNKAMNYSNQQLSKAGLNCSYQTLNCEKFAANKISWNEFCELYTIK